MQIRLLSPFQFYKANQIVSLPIDWERYLIRNAQATYDLTGGIPYVPPAPVRKVVPASLVLDGAGVVLGMEGPGGSLIPVSGGASAPGAPTGLTLTAGAGAVVAAFSPPASNGGSAVTSYTVTLSNGLSGNGLASPISVASPAGVAVTATVKANTAFAPTGGAASAASNSATPTGSGAVATPAIVMPTAIGTPAATTALLNSPQWSLDGVDVAGATAATYTQAIADSSKALRVRETVAGVSATSRAALAGIQNLNLRNTVNLRAMLASGDGYIIGLADSAMSGYMNGGAGSNSANGRANSYLAKLVAKLTAAGFQASKDSAYGCDSTATLANFVAFDPRYTATNATVLQGFGAGQVPVLGGGSWILDASGKAITFTPGGTFDAVEIDHLQDDVTGAIQVSFDNYATSTLLQRNVGSKVLNRVVLSAPAGSTVVSARWASGGGGYLAGLLTRTAASPKIQVINGAMAGAQVVQFLGAVDPAAAGTAYRPRNALGKFIATGKKGVAMLGGFYNDRGASVTLQAVLDALTAICLQLQAANWDIWYIGYPSLDGSGLTQAQFDAWEQPIIALLRDTFNAVIFQESKIFTNYATYNALGYYGDTLHVSNLATTKIADSLMSAIALSNSGALPA